MRIALSYFQTMQIPYIHLKKRGRMKLIMNNGLFILFSEQ